MILSLYFQRHFDYLINSSHGYDTDEIMVAQLYNHNRIVNYKSTTVNQLKERFERIKNVGKKLDECPMIERWMNSSTAVWDGSPTPIVNDKDETFELQSKFVSIEFFDFWGLEISYIAIVISCLGLLGISLFDIRRTGIVRLQSVR